MLKNYDAAFLYNCWFLFIIIMGLLIWKYRPFWQDFSVKSLILRWPIRPVGLLFLKMVKNYLFDLYAVLSINQGTIFYPYLIVTNSGTWYSDNVLIVEMVSIVFRSCGHRTRSNCLSSSVLFIQCLNYDLFSWKLTNLVQWLEPEGRWSL